MNKLPLSKRVQILSMLVEGSSMRSTARVCDVSLTTVIKLVEDAGEACLTMHDDLVHDVRSRRVQCDEIWAYCYAKAKNVKAAKAAPAFAGDVWTWTALDADSKLILSYAAGSRNAVIANAFMKDVASRLANRVQLTTDAHRPYLKAVEAAFDTIDYAQLIKIYGAAPDGPESRYSPPECIGIRKETIEGNPDPKHVSTSYVERMNLNIRMSMRRFTRLTNAFSKKFDNHLYALAIYFMFYNFCRIHKTLRVTPAMAAGVAQTAWTMEDIVARMDQMAPALAPRGPYKKRAAIPA